jgi:alkylmercury lyase
VEPLTKDTLIEAYRQIYDAIPQDALEHDLRVTIKTIQALSRGNPVPPEQLAEIWEMPIEHVSSILERASVNGQAQVDAQGNLIGGVLSLVPTTNRIAFDGDELYAWCAYDAIYAPGVVGKTANIVSEDPLTREPIKVTISPSGVQNVQPAGAVVSVVNANTDFRAGPTSPRCSLQLFFSSRDSATRWLGDRTDVIILSVEEVFEIARQFQIEPARRLGLL